MISKNLLSRKQSYFFEDLNGYNGMYRQIEDDHESFAKKSCYYFFKYLTQILAYKMFLKKGVPILHLIPSPFPQQWHKINDRVEELSKNNIQDLRLIFKYFLLEILHVNIKF